MKRYDQRTPNPGGYRKKTLTTGTCVCCKSQPIARGNLKLCTWCYTDSWDEEFRPDPDLVTREDCLELTVKVMVMEQTPPTPVKHFSCDDYTQEELRAILKGEIG